MSIFVASTKSISRSNGQSAVASASYRAGEKLYDNRHGKTHDYSKRTGVLSADIIMPDSLKNYSISRAELWNLAEKSERRKDSRVAREWLINLPHELDEQTRQNLAHTFAQNLSNQYGVIADCAIHRPTEKEIARGADPRNFHAHILLTTRRAELKNGELVLEKKADSELSDNDRKKKGLCRMSDEITQIRELWQNLANEKLAEFGAELIDRRSYEELGIDKIAQVKMGAGATALERDGKRTAKGDINREILEYNELVFNRELEYIEQTNAQADRIIFESRKQHERAEQQREQQRITDNRIFFASQIEQQSTQLINRTTNNKQRIGQSEQRIADTQRIIAEEERRVKERLSFDNENKRRLEQSESVINDSKQRASTTQRAAAQCEDTSLYNAIRASHSQSKFDDTDRRLSTAAQRYGTSQSRVAESKRIVDESNNYIEQSNQELNRRAERLKQQNNEPSVSELVNAGVSLHFLKDKWGRELEPIRHFVRLEHAYELYKQQPDNIVFNEKSSQNMVQKLFTERFLESLEHTKNGTENAIFGGNRGVTAFFEDYHKKLSQSKIYQNLDDYMGFSCDEYISKLKKQHTELSNINDKAKNYTFAEIINYESVSDLRNIQDKNPTIFKIKEQLKANQLNNTMLDETKKLNFTDFVKRYPDILISLKSDDINSKIDELEKEKQKQLENNQKSSLNSSPTRIYEPQNTVKNEEINNRRNDDYSPGF